MTDAQSGHADTNPGGEAAIDGRLPARSVEMVCLAPLIAYASTLVSAVILALLAIAGLAIAGGPSSSDAPIGGDDPSGVGVLVGLPFQLVGLGLFGSLHFHGGGVAASLSTVPVLLTAVYAVAVFVVVRRALRQLIASRRQMLLMLGFAGIASGTVITLITWLLAMRESGTNANAASPALFVGVFALTVLPSALAQRSSLTRRTNVPTHELLLAVRVWLLEVAVWVVLSSVVLTILLCIKEGFGWVTASPLWAPTASLATYGAARFGGFTASGGIASFHTTQGISPWQALGTAGFLVALLVALVLGIVTSILWHQSRQKRSDWLLSAASWAVLPIVYTVGGVLIILVTQVRADGDFFFVSGAGSLRLAIWWLPVLALWGLAVEASSRYVAPALAQVVPASALRVSTRPIAIGTLEDEPTTEDGQAPQPLSPSARKKLTRGLLAAGIVAVVAVVGGDVVTYLNHAVFGPEQQAQEYLDAVSGHDADEAMELSRLGSDGQRDLMTKKVYARAGKEMSGLRVHDVKVDGETAVASIRSSSPGSQDPELNLEKAGHRFLFFDKWRIADQGLAGTLDIVPPDGSDRVTVNGITIDLSGDSSTTFWALPGNYDVDLFAGNKWVDADTQTATVTTDSFEPAYVEADEVPVRRADQ